MRDQDPDDRTVEVAGASDRLDDRTIDVAATELEDRTVDAGLSAPARERAADRGARPEISAQIVSATGEGLDPHHRIDPIPEGPQGSGGDLDEGATGPHPEAGVRPWLPVVYGARAMPAARSAAAHAAPPAPTQGVGLGTRAQQELAAEREARPSLARREQRRGALTVALYATAIVVGVVGVALAVTLLAATLTTG